MPPNIDSQLTLDISAALRRVGELEAAIARGTTGVPVAMDVSTVQRQLEAAVLAAAAQLDVTVDQSTITGQVSSAVAAADATVAADVDAASLQGQVSSAVAGSTARVPVVADTTTAEAQIGGVGGRAPTVRVPVEADTTPAEREIGGVGGRVPTVRVPVTADTSQAQAEIFALGSAGQQATAALQSSLGGAGAATSVLASGLTTATGAAVGLAGAAGVMGGTFETTFARMVGLAGVPADEIGRLRDAVLSLSGVVGIGPQELAEALYFIESAGLRSSDSLEVLTSSARAAAAGLGDTVAVANAVTNVIGAYGEGVVTAAEVTDVLVATVREGKAEAGELADQFGRAAPQAAQLGVSIGELGGLTAFLTTVLGDTGQSITGLSSLMRNLQLPTEQAREALASVGLTVEQVRATIREQGLLAGLNQLNEAFAGNSELLGRVISDQQGYNAALAITGANNERAAASVAAVTDSLGAVDQAFNAVTDTAQFRARQAFATLQAQAITLGSGLLPLATQAATLAGSFLSIVGPVASFVGSVGGAAGPVLAFAAALFVLDRAVTPISTRLVAASAGVGRLATVASVANTALGVASVALAGYAAAQAAWSSQNSENAREFEASVNAITTAADRMQVSLEAATIVAFQTAIAGSGDEGQRFQGVLDQLGLTVEQVVTRVAQGAEGMEYLRDQAEAAGMSGELVDSVFAGVAARMEEAARRQLDAAVAAGELSDQELLAALAASDASTSTGEYGAALDYLTVTGGLAAGAADDVNSAVTDAAAAALSAASNFRLVGDEFAGLDQLGTSSNVRGFFEDLPGPAERAAEAVGELNDAIGDYLDRTLGVDEATDRLAGDFNDLAAALQAAREEGHPLEGFGDTALQVRDDLRGIVDDTGRLVQSLNDQGASTDQVNGVIAEQLRRLDLLALAYPELADEIGIYQATIAGLPRRAETEVVATGAPEAREDVEDVREAVETVPNRLDTRITMDGAGTAQELAREYAGEVRAIPESWRTTISADAADAISAAGAASSAVMAVPNIGRTITYMSNAQSAAVQATTAANTADSIERAITYGSNAAGAAAAATSAASTADSIERSISYSHNGGSAAASAGAAASSAPNITRTITYFTRFVGAIAEGGPVFPGMPYVAGELGPERAGFNLGSATLGGGGPELVQFSQPAMVDPSDVVRSGTLLARARMVRPTQQGDMGGSEAVGELRALRAEVAKLRDALADRPAVGVLNVNEVAQSPLATARAAAAAILGR